ncbi:MAG: hypothetical protein KIS67_00795 [Verrucomicrobiae bacterium]|nr:hypothetical protein [Verrucomicrobiae bacterium]
MNRAPGYMVAMRDFQIVEAVPEPCAGSRRRVEAEGLERESNSPPHVGGYGSGVQGTNWGWQKSLPIRLGMGEQGPGSGAGW